MLFQFLFVYWLQTAIFMGCKSGEIEIGLANVSDQVRNPHQILEKIRH